ncbi:MAG: hypothetical protein KA052_01785 [Candidatus Pacebacteria bacterium]|nr:hypothetical protein [Candidatus Paceibacterota bacterium]
MVAMSIFSVLVTMGMQAVLSAMAQHRQSEAVRTVMDSLSFVIEDMTRNIRLGTNIRCVLPSDGVMNSDGSMTPTGIWRFPSTEVLRQSCPVGSNKIVFNGVTHTGGASPVGGYITYVFTTPLSASPGVIIKQKGDDMTTAQVITPPEVVIDFERSGFLVRGSEWPGGDPVEDHAQPTVVIRIAGNITTDGVVTPFALQTSVVLRALDPL